MKTIEEACKECVTEAENCLALFEDDYDKGYISGLENGFKDGVKFAQRWINVKDELPEPHKSVLVKDKGGYFFVAERSVFGWLDTQRQEYCESYRTIVYWRPIELK
ncbi:MAG: hypothetical protein LBF04_04175 [Prevotellaceae bacterium]|jgi:hypothetical protein|nr:hypothetical protein [Prevotellaceae bacterium]